jgi:hypothetical protein
MSKDDPGQKPGDNATNDEAAVWERLDRNDELDEGVIAADDTGMLGGAAQTIRIETEERLPD